MSKTQEAIYEEQKQIHTIMDFAWQRAEAYAKEHGGKPEDYVDQEYDQLLQRNEDE